MKHLNQRSHPSRREFLRTAASAAAAVPLLSPGRWRFSPNATLNVAHVGVGGQGWSDLREVSTAEGVRIVAVCDVDANNLGRAAEMHPGAKTFRDWRRLFDAMAAEIDAVVVSTPDHTHGPVAIAALQSGKHVYCQKPIAHNLRECRMMTELAAANDLVTQMGTQIHSHEAYRTAVATLRRGVIGKVSEVHLWVGKSWAGPAEGRPDRTDPVPGHLDWDLWLGVAPERPYVDKLYHPAWWREWLDFGSGTLGDMGCHIFDPVFSALDLGAPNRVISRGPQHGVETFAPDSDIVWEFPGNGRTAETLTFRWTDGERSRPDASRAQLPDGVGLPASGSFLVGEGGVMVIPHWSMPSVYRDGERVEVELEMRDGLNHYHEWAAACRGEGRSSTPFSYSGPLTEAVLLGAVAGRFRNRWLGWNSEKLSFDDPAANAAVGRTYRRGWEITGL